MTFSADRFLRSIADESRLVHVEHLEPSHARFGDLERPLPDRVREALGVERFWSHQAEAIDLIRSGRSVAIATPTASGKSLCYQAPIAEAVTSDSEPATAMMVFPTKALAQDQLRSITALGVDGVVAATYDGDTTTAQRKWVRSHANVILTNPEMLHVGILPTHARWSTFLSRLRYVVIDELHTLRGVFGTHVAHLIRRLRRVCEHYGSDPVFVFCSATIGEPGRLASELCAGPVTEVTDDGSPRAERWFALWNPATAADDPSGDETWSANRDTARLVRGLVTSGHRTIAFCRSRKGTEIVAAEIRRTLPAELARTVRSYRSGYLATERREIENELFTGELRAVVATSALELGVDIGGLDACVLDGFPGTIASMWQQAGRAGRDSRSSVAILVAGDDQLDQWLMEHPHEVFTRSPEPAVVNTANPFVLLPHLACAAYELPLSRSDERWWPDGLLDDGIRDLVLDDILLVSGRGVGGRAGPVAVWAARGRPAARVGLRSGTMNEVRIEREDGSLIGTVDHSRAPSLVHPGAIYLHQGQPYRVIELDDDELIATVDEADGSEYTQPRTETEITIIDESATREVGAVRFGIGRVLVHTRVTGYRRYDVMTGELLGTHDLFLAPAELETTGFWWTVTTDVLDDAGIEPSRIAGTLHAVEHASIGILPLFTICDRWDVGGVSTPLQTETGLPTVVIHDAYPGGAGIARLGFDSARRLLETTKEVISGCRCSSGCPSCIQSPKCGNGNEPLDKAGALALLEHILA